MPYSIALHSIFKDTSLTDPGAHSSARAAVQPALRIPSLLLKTMAAWDTPAPGYTRAPRSQTWFPDLSSKDYMHSATSLARYYKKITNVISCQ